MEKIKKYILTLDFEANSAFLLKFFGQIEHFLDFPPFFLILEHRAVLSFVVYEVCKSRIRYKCNFEKNLLEAIVQCSTYYLCHIAQKLEKILKINASKVQIYMIFLESTLCELFTNFS